MSEIAGSGQGEWVAMGRDGTVLTLELIYLKGEFTNFDIVILYEAPR